MSFGLSVGDLIAITNLAFKVCATIRGSPVEHIKLVLQLETFRRSLGNVNNLTTDLQLSRCWQLLQNLSETNAKYIRNGLLHEGLENEKERPLRELRWGREEFIKSLDDLRSQIGSLDSFLQAYNMKMVQESNIILGRIEKRILASMEQWLGAKPIRFIDALDRHRDFWFELCETWEGFQEFLNFSFKDSVGKSWVDAGRYEITDESKGNILTAKGWNDSIEPGMTLSMAILLQKQDIADNTGHSCPSCDSPYGGAKSKVLEGVRCNKCATWFRISSKPRIMEIGDGDDGPGALDNPAKNIPWRKTDTSFDTDGVKYFRRLHVVLASMNIPKRDRTINARELELLIEKKLNENENQRRNDELKNVEYKRYERTDLRKNVSKT